MAEPSVAAAFRTAVAARDLDAIMALMAPGVTLKSPIMGGTFLLEGPREVEQAFRVLLDDFDHVELTAAYAGDAACMIEFSGRAKGEPFDAVQRMRLDAGGKIAEVVLFVRPFLGLAAFTRAVGPGFMRPHRRTWAWFAAAYGWFVAGWVRVLVWLGAPMVKASIRRLAARPTLYPRVCSRRVRDDVPRAPGLDGAQRQGDPPDRPAPL